VAAAIACLKKLMDLALGVYADLEQIVLRLEEGHFKIAVCR
jgi:hypothetical protein